MPTLRQLEAWVKHHMAQGKGDLHCNHPVIIEDEAAKRAKNEPDEQGRRKTKITWESDDPACYAEFHREREKYFKAAGGNPVLATEAIIMALKVQDFESVRRFVEAIAETKAEDSTLPRAEIPAWEKEK